MVMNLKETVGNCVVSTVSLQFADMIQGNYETMIIKNGNFMEYQERYETEEEAVIGHNDVIMKLKQGDI
jgi:hypothetical protein